MLLLAVVVMAALSVVAVGHVRSSASSIAAAPKLQPTRRRWRRPSADDAAAQRLAAGNGAHLVSYSEIGDVVTVVVDVDGERATARATDGP